MNNVIRLFTLTGEAPPEKSGEQLNRVSSNPGNSMGDIELIAVIGEAATVALAEEFAGTRLYIPKRLRDSHRITRAIGREAADALCAHYSPATIRVPMMRELRAKHHRANGLSQARIAVRLGMTEKGVNSLFRRLKQRNR